MATKTEFKKIVKLIDNLTAEMDQVIEKRTEYFEEKSEKWQESEKGENYSYMTDQIQEYRDSLDDTYNELNEED